MTTVRDLRQALFSISEQDESITLEQLQGLLPEFTITESRKHFPPSKNDRGLPPREGVNLGDNAALYMRSDVDGRYSFIRVGRVVDIVPDGEEMTPDRVKEYYAGGLSEFSLTTSNRGRAIIQYDDGQYSIGPVYEGIFLRSFIGVVE